jgi:hypothetical protein
MTCWPLSSWRPSQRRPSGFVMGTRFVFARVWTDCLQARWEIVSTVDGQIVASGMEPTLRRAKAVSLIELNKAIDLVIES